MPVRVGALCMLNVKSILSSESD